MLVMCDYSIIVFWLRYPFGEGMFAEDDEEGAIFLGSLGFSDWLGLD